ncbi:PH domain-containing protein [Radiobacillus sp. PE A8.2]|uniref:PH domain-containing protein n=1 Tax=Radiobacillus sp. PE A8.2 TaxID=3380349 RepID=UPI00388DDF85
MSEPKRMHPGAMILSFFKVIREIIIPAGVGFFASFNNVDFFGVWFQVLYIAVIAIGTILFSFLTWYRFTYKIDDDQIKIESGIIIRKERFISKNRIQSIDLTEGIVHRIFGLVKVEVQTAGSSTSAEAGLKAVKRAEGEAIREQLKNKSKIDEVENELEEPSEINDEHVEQGPVRKLSFIYLFIAATTSGGIGVFLSLFALFGSQITQFIPEEFVEGVYDWAIHLSIIIIVVLAILIAIVLWLMAIAGTFLKYSFFTIKRNNDELFIARGLLERKQLTIPLKRIQAVRIEENPLRQPFGFATIAVEIAGGSSEQGEGFSTVLFPLIKKTEIEAFLSDFLPSFELTKKWKPLPTRSMRRYLIRAVAPVLIVLTPVSYFFFSYAWIALIFILAAGLLGWHRYRDAGYTVTNNQLAIRTRTISRVSVFANRKRVQAFATSAHWFQARKQLCTLAFSVASHSSGKKFKIKDIDQTDADTIANWYSFEK